MISEFKGNGVRIQIDLLTQIRLPVFSHIMVDPCHRHNQRNIFISILINNFEQLLFFIRGQLLFKITHDMLKNTNVFLSGF